MKWYELTFKNRNEDEMAHKMLLNRFNLRSICFMMIGG